MIKTISQRWRLLSGQDNWRNLLQPLDHDLRKYLIQYGERAQATYDTFNSQIFSRFAGSSIFPMKSLFSDVGLTKGNPFEYKVVKYLYATSKVGVPNAFLMRSKSKDSLFNQSNFMGYVAVATDEAKKKLGRRDILVAWRGTVLPTEWLKDFDYPLVPASEILGKSTHANVHQGFLSLYTSSDPASTYNKASARQQALDEIKKQMEQFKNEETSITITGHSMGGALSILNAVDIAVHGCNKTGGKAGTCPVTAFVFGCPRVGDLEFAKVFDSVKDLHLLSVKNVPDIVPMVPPSPPFADIGEVLHIDSRMSPYLKFTGPADFVGYHLLEPGYLHTLAGTQGPLGGFHFDVPRDISLINKSADMLKDQYMIPPNWWGLKDKGMVQLNDGFWKLEDHDRDD